MAVSDDLYHDSILRLPAPSMQMWFTLQHQLALALDNLTDTVTSVQALQASSIAVGVAVLADI